VNIAFLAVNCSYSHSSLASWCLHAALPREGNWNWHTIEVTVKDAPQTVIELVLASQPQVVAASLYLFNRHFVIELLALIRSRAPECLIVVGGPECLGDNRALVVPAGPADAALRGEGERAFPELLRRLAAGVDWRNIPGLCTAGLLQEYRDNGVAEELSSLDTIPTFYRRELAGFMKPFIQLETSRGCSNGCLFCTSRQTTIRTHSLERIRSDLHDIQQAGVREVRIVDRTFNEEHGRAMLLTSLFRDEFPAIRFHLEIDPARFGEALAREFSKAEAGQFHIEAGIQSLNQAVYDVIERKASVARTLDGLRRLCALRNVEVHVDLIAGLPGGTRQGLADDLHTIIALEPAEIQLERLKLLPGTPLAESPVKWGLIASPSPPYQVMRTMGMTPDDLGYADQLSKVLDWFYNQESLRASVTGGVRTIPSFLDELTRRVGERAGFAVCPNLEDRFLILDAVLEGELRDRLRYRWYGLGFSTRHGPCPSEPWKTAIPDGAVLVEGDASVRVSRMVRVDLATPHLFCYGTGPAGERAVVAVYRL